MRIKLDENLGRRGKEILTEAGFEVQTVVEQNMCSASDIELINKCREEKRVLVTLDKDFSNPFLFRPSEYYGIAVIRLTMNPKPEELYMCVELLAGTLHENDISEKLWIVQEKNIRVYQPWDED